MSWCPCVLCLRGDELQSLSKVIKSKDTSQGRRWINEYKSNGSSQALLAALTLAVEKGDVNVRTADGTSPLHLAVGEKRHELIKELVLAGADCEMIDIRGQSPLGIAEASGDMKLASIIHQEMSKKRTSLFNKELEFVAHLPLFSSLSPSDYPKLAAAFTTRSYPPGDVVFKQGDVGDTFCIIQSGCAAVKVQMPAAQEAEKVAELKPGDFFGEMALLHDQPRNATIEALDMLLVHVLSRSDFNKLDLRNKLHFKKRKAVGGAEVPMDMPAAPPTSSGPKTALDRKLIEQGLFSNTNLGPLLSHLYPADVQALVDNAYSITVEKDTQVVAQGDLAADNFYVVADGSFSISKDGNKLCNVGPGGSFGELALIYQTPRAATVTATAAARLWVVNRQQLKRVCRSQVQQQIAEYTKLFAKVPLFQDISADGRAKLADALVATTYDRSDYIIQQGDRGDFFFVLQTGCVVVEKDGRVVNELSGGAGAEPPYFGEKALLGDESRAASIRVKSETATVLALNRAVFLEALGRSERKIEDYAGTMIKYSLSELQRIGLLGCGGFGSVSLVKCKATNNYFALKALHKGHIIQCRQTEKVKSEKNILAMTSSPFLIRCAATFNSQNHLFFLLEPAMGGELWTLLRRHNFTGSDLHARFYTACVLRGLAYMHQQFIIYRDLKSENLLLDNSGYCKITDFGLAKFAVGHTYTTCGTPDYFAPELIAATGHTFSLDWWTLGVLVFELMTGDAPFTANSPMAIFQKVKRGINAVRFRSSAPWTNLVKSLCAANPSARLPMRPGGVKNVETHDWYRAVSFDWGALDSRSMQPPFRPELKDPSDISNFDAEAADLPPQPRYTDPGTGWDVGFESPYGPRVFD